MLDVDSMTVNVVTTWMHEIVTIHNSKLFYTGKICDQWGWNSSYNVVLDLKIFIVKIQCQFLTTV